MTATVAPAVAAPAGPPHPAGATSTDRPPSRSVGGPVERSESTAAALPARNSRVQATRGKE